MSIAEQIQRLQLAKEDIKSAIIEKGGSVEDNALLDTYGNAIRGIEVGGSGGEENTNWFSTYGAKINGSGVVVNDDGSITIDENAGGVEITIDIPILPNKDGYICSLGVDLSGSNNPNPEYDLLLAEFNLRDKNAQTTPQMINLDEHFTLEMGQDVYYDYPCVLHILLIIGVMGIPVGTRTIYPNLCKGTELKPWKPYNF